MNFYTDENGYFDHKSEAEWIEAEDAEHGRGWIALIIVPLLLMAWPFVRDYVSVPDPPVFLMRTVETRQIVPVMGLPLYEGQTITLSRDVMLDINGNDYRFSCADEKLKSASKLTSGTVTNPPLNLR